MDIQHFLSGTRTFSFDYNQLEAQPLPFQLYDQQSQQQDQHIQYSVQDIVQIMLRKQQIMDKPMNQIVYQAVNQYQLAKHNVNQFIKLAKKTKNILKRNRAKSRLYTPWITKSPTSVKRQLMYDESSTDKDNSNTLQKQIKKQRNRISAQISRDRKKNYVTNLEMKNKYLSQQSQILRIENQRLRQQIQSKYQNNNNNKEQNKNKNGNKFTRLLVLLGFVFLMYLLKDIFNFKGNKSVSTLKQAEVSQQELPATNPMTQTTDIIEQIRNQITHIQFEAQNQCTQSIMGKGPTSFKQALIKKVCEIKRKTKQIMLPDNLAANLFQIKNIFNF